MQYFHSLQNRIFERFLGFVTLEELTGSACAQEILQFLRDECQLELDCLHGQAYDGAGAMKGKIF